MKYKKSILNNSKHISARRDMTGLTSPKNRKSIKECNHSAYLDNSNNLFKDKKALKRLSSNLRNLYNDLVKSPTSHLG